MYKLLELFLLSVVVTVYINGEITVQEYASMPILFHLDDYDHCLLNEKYHRYCLFTYEMAPLNDAHPSKTWQIIKTISSDRMKYRHDRLRHGLCVTDHLRNKTDVLQKSNDDVKKLIKGIYDKKYEHLGLHGSITEMKCENFETEYKITYFDHLLTNCCIAYLAFIFLASVFNAMTTEEDVKNSSFSCKRVLLAFSLSKNWKKLTKVVDSPVTIQLRSFQGIRVLSLMIVIFTHNALIISAAPTSNPQFLEEVMHHPTLSYIFSNGVLLVQNYFLMSSWLLTYYTFEKCNHMESITFSYVIKIIIYRYIRLTPVLLVVLLFNVSWLAHVSRGPYWEEFLIGEYYSCRRNWWRNILYINTLGDMNDLCMQHTWYIGNDTIYFIFGLIFLWSIWRYKKYFLQTVIVITILFQAAVFIHLYTNKYNIAPPLFPEEIYMAQIIHNEAMIIGRTWYVNMGGLFAGLIWGYIYFKYKDVDIPKTKGYEIFYYVSVFALAVIMICSPGYLFLEKKVDKHSPLMAGYCILSRFFAPFSLGYSLFLLSKNQIVVVKWFLESKFMVILGRTSYSLYMVHLTFNYIRGGQIKQIVSNSYYHVASEATADFVFSVIFSWILTLTIESPLREIIKMLFAEEVHIEKLDGNIKVTDNVVHKNDFGETLKTKNA